MSEAVEETNDTIVPHARFVEARERRQRTRTAFTELSTEITRRHDADDASSGPAVDDEPPPDVPRELRSVIDMRRADPYVGGDHPLFSV